MIETQQPLEIPAGLYRNGTRAQSAGRWYDANGVRFFRGSIRPIGGWGTTAGTGTLSGTPAAIIASASVTSLGTPPAPPFNPEITPGVRTRGVVVATTAGLFAKDTLHTTGWATITPAISFGSQVQLDASGDTVLCATNNQQLAVWKGDVSTAAIVEPNSPTCSGVVITPERYAVVLQAGGDPRTIAWPDQDGTSQWNPAAVGATAGDFTLGTTGTVLAGRRSRHQTLLFTTDDLHAMNYIGGDLIYSVEPVGANCGLVGAQAVAMVDSQAFWMSSNGFFHFDGFVRPLRCDVADTVFGNHGSLTIAWAMTLPQYSEVWWFYPANGSAQCDRYVVYNYAEDHWSRGTLSRAAGALDATQAFGGVLMVGYDGKLYAHESGTTRTGLAPSLESGPIEIEQGGRIARVQQLVTDEVVPGTLRVTVSSAMQPDAAETTVGPTALANPTPLRVSGRHVRLKFDEVTANLDWRLGRIWLGILPGERR